jgi:hypothetical protein
MSGSTSGPGGSLAWATTHVPAWWTDPAAWTARYHAALDTTLPPLRDDLLAASKNVYTPMRFAETFSASSAFTPSAALTLTQSDPLFTVVEWPTKPHAIDARTAPNLVFYWTRERRWFRGPHVNHPGTLGKQFIAPILAEYAPRFAAALTGAAREAFDA